jgi:D-alanyl-D-alanine dipeptidase
VQERLAKSGYGLLIWDAYRPISAQRALWRAKPDRRFVAPPWTGGKHNRGAAVDVTLCDKEGRALPMPSEFDEFSPRAASTYSGGPRGRRENRNRLHAAMAAEGFQQDRREWWHFQDPEWKKYPVADVPLVDSTGTTAKGERP